MNQNESQNMVNGDQIGQNTELADLDVPNRDEISGGGTILLSRANTYQGTTSINN